MFNSTYALANGGNLLRYIFLLCNCSVQWSKCESEIQHLVGVKKLCPTTITTTLRSCTVSAVVLSRVFLIRVPVLVIWTNSSVMIGCCSSSPSRVTTVWSFDMGSGVFGHCHVLLVS